MAAEAKDGLWVRAARLFDLPQDILGDTPRVEILGHEEFRMGPHRGILSYGTDGSHISGGKLVVRVTGSNLEIRAMTPAEVLITGTLESVEFVR